MELPGWERSVRWGIYRGREISVSVRGIPPRGGGDDRPRRLLRGNAPAVCRGKNACGAPVVVCDGLNTASRGTRPKATVPGCFAEGVCLWKMV